MVGKIPKAMSSRTIDQALTRLQTKVLVRRTMEALHNPNTQRMVPSAYTSRIQGKIWFLTTSMQLPPVKPFVDQFLKSPRETRRKTAMISRTHQVTWIPSIRKCKTKTIITLVPVQIRLDRFEVMLEDMASISKIIMLVRSLRVVKIK